MKKNRIIIDAMGGDHAPKAIVEGAVLAAKASNSLQPVLVGDQEKVKTALQQFDITGLNFEVVPATEVIGMEESPKSAVAEKPDASINVACRMLEENEGDALVSAGNTGATIISCSKNLSKISGVERAVLAAVLPAMKNKPEDSGRTILLDVGATLHCSPSQLVQFAIMGTHYAREVLERETPRLALLNIGEEETKGHDTLIETYSLFKKLTGIQFIGNVEGKDVMRGIADVIVCEGFIGNIVLKALEGAAEMGIATGKRIWKKNLLTKLGITLLAPTLKKIKKNVDYKEQGGAPILGFTKLVIKAHGRSNAKAIKNAVLMAERTLKHDMVRHIQKDIYEVNKTFFSVIG
ncbi:MAG: phosphate acyltransferase PlsX [Calditrichia bacterium]